jgi:hypothetical protein
MSKRALTHEIRKELDRLNDRIDRKIVKGERFDTEARRHRELLATLHRVEADSSMGNLKMRKPLRFMKSPVRRSLNRGVFARLFTFQVA